MRKLALLAPALLALAACNTPGSRIKKNQEVFDTYPPDVQASIRSGQIQPGFDQNQTYMALGKPQRKSAESGQETWLYTRTVQRTVTQKKDVYKYEVERRDYEDKKARGEPAVEPSMEETFVLRRTQVVRVVHFADGRVASWDEPTDEYVDEWH